MTFGVVKLVFLLSTITTAILIIYNYGRSLLPYVQNYFTSKSSKLGEATISPGDDETLSID